MSPFSGWRPSLRLAWRDALRARARSALVLAMIALPVLAVTAADVIFSTSEISGAEALDRRLGAADARVSTNAWVTRVSQTPDPDAGVVASSGGSRPRRPAGLAELAAALGRPLRGIEQRTGELAVETARGASPVEGTELDLTDPLAAGLWTITSGRAAAAPDEVVVNRDLASRGPGLGDSLQVVDGPALTVVGVGDSTTSYGYPLVVAPPGTLGLGAEGDRTWLVDAGGPVDWDDVLALNAAGATVLARDVMLHPPDPSRIPPEARMGASGSDSSAIAAVVLIVVMALLEVVLLAGPAFAVGARRQSRTLALMAAAGGTPAQARRTILAGGVVLGGLGAGIGVALGLAVARLGLPVFQRFSSSWFGPFDVKWPHVAVIAGFGLVSAFLAAVVPAWIASRQDVVAVLAGRRGDRRASRRSPVLGVALLAVGVAGAAVGSRREVNAEIFIAAAAVVSVLGMILLVPLVLVVLSRLSGRLPLGLRFAVRDAARHRTRTVPAVAAVAATVAGVVALGIANASDAAEGAATYHASLPLGDAAVYPSDLEPGAWARVRTIIEREIPDAQVAEVAGVREEGAGAASLTFRTATTRELLMSYGSSLGSSVLVASRLPDDLPGLPALTGVDEVLAAGGVVVLTDGVVAADTVIVGGRVFDRRGRPTGHLARRELPAVFVTVGLDAPFRAVLSPEAARQLEVTVQTVGMNVTGATVSRAQQRNVSEAIAAITPYSGLYVERGYEASDSERVVMLILAALGAVLMVGGTVTATLLALSDARADLATLAAVGAAPRTRRGVAAAFTFVIASVGAVLGAAVGFVPGVAVTYPLTHTTLDGFSSDAREVSVGPFVDIPWLLIGGLVVALPLLTTLVVGLAARSRLPMVARLD